MSQRLLRPKHIGPRKARNGFSPPLEPPPNRSSSSATCPLPPGAGRCSELTPLRHTGKVEQMGRGAQGLAIAGVAVLCGFVAAVLAVVVLFLIHSHLLFS